MASEVGIKRYLGDDERIPENIRDVTMWLIAIVADLHYKWKFYLELFGDKETHDLLKQLAHVSFEIIEQILLVNVIIEIGYLSDSPTTGRGDDNLSIAYLVKNCSSVAGLDALFTDFQNAAQPVRKVRNKLVGHKDFQTLRRGKPDMYREQIDRALKLAAQILDTVFRHYTGMELLFDSVTRSPGDAKDLIALLKAGKEFHARKL